MKSTKLIPIDFQYECPYCGKVNYITDECLDDDFFEETHYCHKCNKEFKVER